MLKPVLGRVQLVFYGVGVIIGAGIYSVIGAAAGLAQQGLWISFLIGAGVALLTALSYAEMTTAFPQAGAEYVYTKKAWPRARWLSFGVGVCILFGGAATASTVALAFGNYLQLFVPMPSIASAFVLLVLSTAIGIWGLRETIWVTVALTLIEIAGLLVIVAAALWGIRSPLPPLPPPEAVGVMSAAALLFFVYLGFEEIANLAEEVREPASDLPFALLASLGVTTALYMAVAMALPMLAAPADLAASGAPLTTAVEGVWPRLGGPLGAIALFATANTVLATVIAVSRLAFSMARDGEIGRAFARTSAGRHTPWAALLLVLALSVALLPLGGVRMLAELSSFAALLAFLIVNIVVIVLRFRMPDHPRPFRTPLAIGRLPVLPILAVVSIIGLLGYFEWQIYAAAAVVFGLSAVAYLLQRRRPS